MKIRGRDFKLHKQTDDKGSAMVVVIIAMAFIGILASVLMQSLIHITMPYMLFVTGPSLVTDFVKNINNFNVIYLLTQGVYTTTNQAMANSQAKEVDLLITWLFNLTQSYYNYKMASTIGIIVFILCAVFTLIAFSRFLKGDREEAFR
jgi:arabinogalactan oligomer/maltooligosaccharide transport system permease protein